MYQLELCTLRQSCTNYYFCLTIYSKTYKLKNNNVLIHWGSCGLGIWTAHIRNGLSLLPNVWGLSQKDLHASSDSTAGAWNHLKAYCLHVYAWAGMTERPARTVDLSTCIHGLAMGLGFLATWRLQGSQTLYLAAQSSQCKCVCEQGRSCIAVRDSLRSQTTSLPPPLLIQELQTHPNSRRVRKSDV